MGSPEEARPRVERLVALADVVKASDEDVAWLYPDAALAEVQARWLALGPALVVVTRGADGADALVARGPVHVRRPADRGGRHDRRGRLVHGRPARAAQQPEAARR